ncbi:MAG: PaaI family thioesterase [Methylibium sp.]|nr:PaaI family thioesterase [Methylibium sp.]
MTPALREAWQREGFQAWALEPGFLPGFAVLMYRPCVDGLEFRVEVLAQHCNESGGVHGGFLSTMADVWLGYNVAHRLPRETRIATAGLSVDFLATAHAGHWLHSTIDRVKVGQRLCHASGAILSEHGVVAAMRGSFAIRAAG